MRISVSLAAACALAGLAAGAATYDVSDVTGLTNAVAKAANDGTLLLFR